MEWLIGVALVAVVAAVIIFSPRQALRASTAIRKELSEQDDQQAEQAKEGRQSGRSNFQLVALVVLIVVVVLPIFKYGRFEPCWWMAWEASEMTGVSKVVLYPMANKNGEGYCFGKWIDLITGQEKLSE